jgi:hypothetical protein
MTFPLRVLGVVAVASGVFASHDRILLAALDGGAQVSLLNPRM